MTKIKRPNGTVINCCKIWLY